MKKASDILILIGYVFSILSSVALLGIAILFVVISTPIAKDIIIQGLESGAIHTDFVGPVEEQVRQIQILFAGLSVMFFVLTAFYITCTVFAFLSTHKDNQGFVIAALVFSILCGNVILIVGEILRLVSEFSNTNQVNSTKEIR